jgi:hypothetical protein
MDLVYYSLDADTADVHLRNILLHLRWSASLSATQDYSRSAIISSDNGCNRFVLFHIGVCCGCGHFYYWDYVLESATRETNKVCRIKEWWIK